MNKAEVARREMLHSAYAAVRGSAMNTAVSSITLDHLLQEQIDVIRGSKKRVSKLDVLDTIEKNINGVGQAARAT
jgi:hypothetical protein